MAELQPNEIERGTGEILAGFAAVEAPLLEILHAVQARFGYLPDAALRTIAAHLNISRAEIHGVATFYHDFRSAPAGRHRLKVCRAEACQAMGATANIARLVAAFGIDLGETSEDGAVTLEAVYCLGLCACAPAAMLDGRPVGRLDTTKLDALIGEVRR